MNGSLRVKMAENIKNHFQIFSSLDIPDGQSCGNYTEVQQQPLLGMSYLEVRIEKTKRKNLCRYNSLV